MRMKNIVAASLVVMLVALPNAPLHAQWTRYRVTYFPGYPPCDLNDSTEILSYSYSSLTAAKWKEGNWTLLPHLDDASYGQSINNASQIVGYSTNTTSSLYKATYWPNTSTVVDIGTLPGDNSAWAFSINSQGVIVGLSWYDSSGSWLRRKPFIYNGTMAPLPGVWPSSRIANMVKINDSGYVVVPMAHPLTTIISRDGAVVAVIPDFYGLNVNNRTVVGGINSSGPAYWSGGTVIPLPGPSAVVTGINDGGTMVGYVQSPTQRGVIWKAGQVKYLDELTVPTYTINLVGAVNNKGEILCRGYLPPLGKEGALLLTPMSEVRAPKAGTTWISGEQDTIRWSGIPKGISLLIEFSSDGGQTYQGVAGNIPADSERYVWELPQDGLSTNCLIRLRDYYTMDSIAVSGKFHVKPYMITEIDPAGNYRPYDIGWDRWGFGNTPAEMWPYTWYVRFNYQGIDPFTGSKYSQWQGNSVFANAALNDFPDWVSFVNTFTVDACYFNKTLGLYSTTALDRWWRIKGKWKGSCYGIATSNALAFERKADFLAHYPHYPSFTDAISVVSDTNTIPVVNELFSHQFGNPHRALSTWQYYYFQQSPTLTLAGLKTMLQEDDVAVRGVLIWNNHGKGGHAILGWKLQRVTGQAGVFHLRVYDNSFPADTNAHIVIDSAANGGNGTWGYANWPTWGGTRFFVLADSASTHLVPPTMPKRQGRTSPFVLNSSELQVLTRTEALVLVTDIQGRKTGFAGDTIMTEIPGSVPMMIMNGSETPPYGYSLPVGSYLVQMSSSTDSVVGVSFCTGNKTYTFDRRGAAQQQSDRLFFDGGVSCTNPDPDSKPITLGSIINNTTDEKVFLLQSLAFSQNDSVKIETVDEAKLKLTSMGTAKSYNIELDYATEGGLARFEAVGVPLGANSSHLMVPEWTSIADKSLTILVDEGNDGTVDDTLHLKNDLTGTDEHGSLIPTEYRLEQNYPNPFNPTTAIRYQLPVVSDVRIVIYDLLGREVAVLVDEKKGPGVYMVEWDAHDVASGVYIYRLTAGGFAQTRKMVVVK